MRPFLSQLACHTSRVETALPPGGSGSEARQSSPRGPSKDIGSVPSQDMFCAALNHRAGARGTQRQVISCPVIRWSGSRRIWSEATAGAADGRSGSRPVDATGPAPKKKLSETTFWGKSPPFRAASEGAEHEVKRENGVKKRKRFIKPHRDIAHFVKPMWGSRWRRPATRYGNRADRRGPDGELSPRAS